MVRLAWLTSHSSRLDQYTWLFYSLGELDCNLLKIWGKFPKMEYEEYPLDIWDPHKHHFLTIKFSWVHEILVNSTTSTRIFQRLGWPHCAWVPCELKMENVICTQWIISFSHEKRSTNILLYVTLFTWKGVIVYVHITLHLKKMPIPCVCSVNWVVILVF